MIYFHIRNWRFLTRKAIEANRPYEKIEGLKFPNLTSAFSSFVNDFKNNELDHCISINPYHNGNKMINEIVRKKLFGQNVKQIVKGDWMLVTQKWSRNGQELFNGDHVVVEDIDLNNIELVGGLYFTTVQLKSKNLKGEEVLINDYLMLDSINYPSGCLLVDMEKALRGERYRKNVQFRGTGNPSDDRYVGAIRLTHGYSITCHKAQGGEWQKVYMGTFKIPSLRYQYTAITRAVTSLVMF